MRPMMGTGSARSAVARVSSAVPAPRLPDSTGAMARPAEGSRSTGREPEPIWLLRATTSTV